MNNMGLLALFVWVAVPLFALTVGLLSWRRARTPPGKGVAVVASIAVLFVPMLVSMGVKGSYDQQVREMCAKDGGVRVFERVTLPANKFSPSGQLNFHIPLIQSGYKALKDTDDYYFERSMTNLRRGNPKLDRRHSRIIRRNDNKVLGESVSYFRRGGDLPGPWSESSFVCPEPRKYKSIESSVFVKG